MVPPRLEPVAVRTALAGLPDAEVVRRVIAGEPALFEVLMRRYNQRVYRSVRSLLRDERECEDAMQQAWLSAYSHLAQFQGASAFSTWLTRIALNEALARLRQRSRLTSMEQLPKDEEDDMRTPAHDPERRASDRELGRMVELAVDELPDLYRSVFMLREVEGLSTAEAATCLGVSDDVVKVRLHRARLALRDALYARAGSAAQDAYTFLGWRCDDMVAKVLGRILSSPPAS
ncbi:MAG: RNA polymerase sigma factor [Anaeromyxobacteraceae bacterium]